MMKIAKAHCLFEQSGTFKDAFLRNGIPAFDYDILDDYIEDDGFEPGYDGRDDEYDAAREDELMQRFGHLAEGVV